MRKLSCKWPLYLTCFAFAIPVFHVLFRVGKVGMLDTQELAVKTGAAIGWTIIAWSVYGVACLLAPPKPEEEHIVYRKDKKKRADKHGKTNQSKEEKGD